MPLTKPPEWGDIKKHSKYKDADRQTRRKMQKKWLDDVQNYVSEVDSDTKAANVRGQLEKKYGIPEEEQSGFLDKLADAGKAVQDLFVDENSPKSISDVKDRTSDMPDVGPGIPDQTQDDAGPYAEEKQMLQESDADTVTGALLEGAESSKTAEGKKTESVDLSKNTPLTVETDDGRFLNIPTVIEDEEGNLQELAPDEAYNMYQQKKLAPLGEPFEDKETAQKWAEMRPEEQRTGKSLGVPGDEEHKAWKSKGSLPESVIASARMLTDRNQQAAESAMWGWAEGATMLRYLAPSAYQLAGDMLEGSGAQDALSKVGIDHAGDAFQILAEEQYKSITDQIQRINKVSPAPDESLTDEWSQLADPRFWAHEVFSAGATMTGSLLAGGGTMGGAAAAGGALEAGPMYQELRQRENMDPFGAYTRSVGFGASVMALEKFGFDKIFKGKSSSALKRHINAALSESVSEYGEEPSEAFLRNLGRRGVTPTELGSKVLNAMKEGVNVIPGALGAGGVASIAREAGNKQKELVGREGRMPDGEKFVVDKVAPGEGIYVRRKGDQRETEGEREFVPIDQMEDLGKLYDTRGTTLEQMEQAEKQLQQSFDQAEQHKGKTVRIGEDAIGTIEEVARPEHNMENVGVKITFSDGSESWYHPDVANKLATAEETQQAEAQESETEGEISTQIEPTPVEQQPWHQADTEQEDAFYGTPVQVIPEEGQGEPWNATVSRIQNQGQLLEVTPEGEEAGTERRVPAERVRVLEQEAEEEVLPEQADDTKLDEQEFPVQQMAPAQIKIDPERFQFKSETDEFGVTQKQPSEATEETEGPLQGKWDEKAAGNLIVWQNKQGDNYIVHGHHRLDLAKRNNVSQVNVQVLKENDGWTEADARAEGALLNIKAGQGRVEDYADFFRQHELTEEKARSEGLLGRDKGRRGFTVGSFATDNTYSAWKRGQISGAKAEAIADIGRDNSDLQDVGLKLARQQKLTAPQLRESLRLMKTDVQRADDTSEQLDLFGQNDAAMQELAAEGKAAAEIQKELKQDRSTLTQAIKKEQALEITKQKAQELGIQDRADQDEIQEARRRIDQELDKWETWSTSPELRRQARERAGLSVEQQPETTPTEAETEAETTPAETEAQSSTARETGAPKIDIEATRRQIPSHISRYLKQSGKDPTLATQAEEELFSRVRDLYDNNALDARTISRVRSQFNDEFLEEKYPWFIEEARKQDAETETQRNFAQEYNLESPQDITVSQAERYVTEGTIPRNEIEDFVNWLENNAGEYVRNNVRRRFQESGLLETQAQDQSTQSSEAEGAETPEEIIRGTKEAMEKDGFEAYAQSVADTEQLPDYVRALARRLLKQSQEGATNYEVMRDEIIRAFEAERKRTETLRGGTNERTGQLFPDEETPQTGQGSLFNTTDVSETGPPREDGVTGEEYKLKGETAAEDVTGEAETRHGQRQLKKLRKDIGKTKPDVGIRSVVQFITDLARTRVLKGKTQTSQRKPAHYALTPYHYIRTRVTDFMGNFHEAGHAMSGFLTRNNWDDKPALADKLIALAQMPGSLASAENAEEGMAEFVRRYVMQPGTIPTSLRNDMENWLRNEDPEMLRGLRDTRRMWKEHRERPLSEQLKANQNDQPPPLTMREQLPELAYDYLGRIIGVSPILHAMRRRFWRAKSGQKSTLGIPRALLSRTARWNNKHAEKFFQTIKDTDMDFTNAFQNIQHIPQEAGQTLAGTPGDLQEGIRIRATDKGFGNLTNKERSYLSLYFNLPTDEQTHGNWTYLTNISYAGIRKKVGLDRWPDFEIYAQYRAALERFNKDKQMYPDIREGADPESVAQMLSDYEANNPDFRERFDELNNWLAQLLLPAVLSGELSAADAIRIRDAWEDYMPLPRQMEKPGQGKGGGPEPDSGIRGAYGSYRNFKDLDDAIHERVQKTYESYYYDRAIKAFKRAIDEIGKDESIDFDWRTAIQQLMIPLRLDQRPVTELKESEQKEIIADAINQMEQERQGQAIAEEDKYGPEDIDLTLPGRPIFRAQKPSGPGVKVVSSFQNGGRQYYQVTDNLLFQIMAQQNNPGQFIKTITNAVRDIGRPWKRVITQNIGFAIRNTVARDPMTAITLSEADWMGMIPFFYVGVGAFNRIMSRSGKGVDMREVRTESELLSKTLDQIQSDEHQGIARRFKDILSEGIVIPNYGQLNTTQKLSKAPGQIMSAILKPIEVGLWATGQRRASQLGEELAREGAFIRARKRGYSQEEAQRQYDRITGDFGKRGTDQNAVGFVRAAQFLNPGLQIAWQQLEQMTHPDPKVRAKFFAAKIPALTFYGGMAAALNHLLKDAVYDDDEEEEINDAMRERTDQNRLRYMSIAGKIRLPFDFGIAGAAMSYGYNSVEEKLLNDPINSDEKATRILERAVDVPGFQDIMPPHLKTWLELNIGKTGYSFFWKDDIMPEWMLDAYPHDPSARAFNDTPQVYKALGEGLNASPVKVAYGIRQMFTRVMDDTIRIMDKWEEGRPIRGQDIPIFGNLLQQKPRGWYSNSVRTVSELNKEWVSLNRRIERMQELGQTPPEKLTERFTELYDAHQTFTRVQQSWQQAKKIRTQIQRPMPDKSADEKKKIRKQKWDKINKIEQRMTDIARGFVERQQERDKKEKSTE